MADPHTDTPEDRRPNIKLVPHGTVPTIGHHLKLMKGSVDTKLYTLAAHWHETLRVGQLHTEEEFAFAWDCWRAALKLQGTISEYRDQLKLEADGLKARYSQWRSEQATWLANSIQGAFATVAATLEENQERKISEVWPKIKPVFEQVISGKRSK